MKDSLSHELLQMHEQGHLCQECPFDAGGVLDCIGVQKYGRCLLVEAAERLKEVVENDGAREAGSDGGVSGGAAPVRGG